MKNVFVAIILLSNISLMNLLAHAEIILDGTLGSRSGVMQGIPDSKDKLNFAIEAGLGQQIEGNLFHSFSRFDLERDQTATFLGPNNIKNVISRVTGGTPSTIDGTISSTIPHADLYFLNPSGILLGKHARLDISGSFYASTADTLYLGEKGQFHAANPEKSILSSASPQAFGFLTDTPQSIHVQGSTLLLKEAGKSLSFIGGSLNIDGVDSPNNVDLFAMGQINLVSLASQGKVKLVPSSMDITPETSGGVITINKLDISRENTGDIFIHGGQLTLKNSTVFKTRWQGQGGVINIRAKNIEIENTMISNNTYGVGKGGEIIIKANDLTLLTGTTIDNSAAFGAGEGGSIIFKIKDTLTIAGGHIINGNSPFGIGKAADVKIEAHRVILKNEGTILNTSMGLGEGGGVHIVADELIMTKADIFGNTLNPLTQADNKIAIEIIAKRIALEEEASITNGTLGLGQGGDIIIKATEELRISGGFLFAGSTRSDPKAGKTGIIHLKAPRIILTKRSIINSDTFSSEAGRIDIQSNTLIIKEGSSIQTKTHGEGRGGTVHITTDELLITGQRHFITSIESTSEGKEANAGDAGEIKIKANVIKMKDNALISTDALNASGGDISIETPTLIHLQQGTIFTNVKGGDGDGGNITIKAPTFMILDDAKIITQAKRGFGGDITIQADQFVLAEQMLSDDLNARNVLNASSDNVARSGTISTPTPTKNIGSFLIVLPSTFVSKGLQPSCASRTAEDFDSFKVTESFESLPQPPEDLTTPILY